ncbi:MAG: SIR2 family NAD-dependent protein deacylase [Acidobacteriota bacterium]
MAALEARRLVVLTGAGISAESGLGTFRGRGGLWENEPVQAVATPQAFAKDPLKVWRFYEARRHQAARAEPNAAHRALAELGRRLGPRLILITQNVDGLHQAAGSQEVLELHGSLWRLRCTVCGAEAEDRTVPLPALPPRCGSCGALLRPCVVWFGEFLPEKVLAKSVAAAQDCALFLVVGTSAVVEPAASLARVAETCGAALWEVNPEATPLSQLCQRSWRLPAGEAMDEVVEEALKTLEAR